MAADKYAYALPGHRGYTPLSLTEVEMNRISMMLVSFVVVMLCCAPDNSSKRVRKGFNNPILAGFYPDPSICKVGRDYYLVNSTFSYFPGIPIFHSRDMVNWTLLSHVLNRPEQLDLNGLGVSRGIFAPVIRHHKGIFYVTCTLVDKGGNFVVTSRSPEGPWSKPVWIPQINGIDPSMFFDENGKAYILYNSIPPDNTPLYEGHRTIRMYEFDVDNLKVKGEEQLLINGGTDITKKPVWIEGPHIFYKNGYYYLIAAEGGTAEQHSEVVFRSFKVDGPYIPYERNPILTQRHLDPNRDYPITCTGHADLVETESGEWWAVFLGCRPYPPFEENHYNTGRETFLAPVTWKSGWPVINPDNEEVLYHYPLPIAPSQELPSLHYSGNFTYRDDFEGTQLDLNWIFLRTPQDKWYNLDRREGFLSMQLRPETCAENVNPSFIGHRQQHALGSASTALTFAPESENEKAGLLVFQNERHFYFLCKSTEDHRPVIQLYKSRDSDGKMELIAAREIDIDQNNRVLFLKIEASGNTYSFLYAYNSESWHLLKGNIDATYLSTKTAAGFVGCVYALYATSLGKTSNNVAYFDWFEYRGIDEVYQ